MITGICYYQEILWRFLIYLLNRYIGISLFLTFKSLDLYRAVSTLYCTVLLFWQYGDIRGITNNVQQEPGCIVYDSSWSANDF